MQCHAQFFFNVDCASDLECFLLHTEAALADVDGLRSDNANLEVAVAVGAAGKVEDASVLAPVPRAAVKRVIAIKLELPRGVASRMRERKLELNSERPRAASENTMRDCMKAVHASGIVRPSAMKNERVHNKEQMWVFSASKRSKGKDRNACQSSFAFTRVVEVAKNPLTESKRVAKTNGSSDTCVRLFRRSAGNNATERHRDTCKCARMVAKTQ